ncbi:hypothetical protein OUZ56_004254 [Daphnia magna]|uniref:Uncharacterized protein n=1 Tax=Daphnia magna TaxID=35525 RepID=A0ABQ9YPD9_9CRUS|nr:hypothetical protein OUZ56_004254 [Daphnia magna]
MIFTVGILALQISITFTKPNRRFRSTVYCESDYVTLEIKLNVLNHLRSQDKAEFLEVLEKLIKTSYP